MDISLPAQPLLLPSPVLIIGSYGPDGIPNIMAAAWGGIVSSDPPCISISLREATLTYLNIRKNNAFTVNIPSYKYYRQADFVGMVSGNEHDKFKETGLTAQKSELVNAPIVAQFSYALECRLIKLVELGLHTMFIGEIIGIMAASNILNEYGLPDIEKVQPVVWGSFGSMAYYSIGNKLGNAFSAGNES